MTKHIDFRRIKEELDTCNNPLFFFDDDPDGLCSFLLLYRYKKEGHGIVVKAKPYLNMDFILKINEYQPHKIFILDMPNVSQDFIDAAKVPVIWIDHHPPQDRTSVVYINPRLTDQEIVPTSYMCYTAVQQDMWIAMIGCIGDWFIPPFIDEFLQKYGYLAEKKYEAPPEYLFETKIGELVKLFSFNLKGKTSEAHKAIKIFCRIKDPQEILKQETAQAKYVYKKYEKINEMYKQLKQRAFDAEKKDKKKPFLVFLYEENQISLTKDLSNELLYRFPKKIIILGRNKGGEVKCSLRSGTNHSLDKALAKALIGIQGYGGGHEHACGCCIKEEDFPQFLNALQTALDL